MSATTDAYIAASAKREQVAERAGRLAMFVTKLGRAFENWPLIVLLTREGEVANEPAFEAKKSGIHRIISLTGWPTAEEIRNALVEYREAKLAEQEAWLAMSDEERKGFNPGE